MPPGNWFCGVEWGLAFLVLPNLVVSCWVHMLHDIAAPHHNMAKTAPMRASSSSCLHKDNDTNVFTRQSS